MAGWRAAAAVYLMIAHGWVCDPRLAALFSPPAAISGEYEVCASDAHLEDAEAEAAADGFTFGPVEALEPLDTFGRAGQYDRFAVAKLYGGRRARVARGWRERGGEFDSITLISPHPDASLTQLRDGTMRITWRTIIRSSQ
jgi:hypothetical protein